MKKIILCLIIVLFVSSLILTVATFAKSADAAAPVVGCSAIWSTQECRSDKKVGSTCSMIVGGQIFLGECVAEGNNNPAVCWCNIQL